MLEYQQGAPYRETFWKNWLLMLDILLLFGFNLFLTVWPDWWPDCAVEFEIFSPPRTDITFRLLLLALVAGNLLASLSCERLLADVLVTRLFRGKDKKHQEIGKILESKSNWPEIADESDGDKIDFIREPGRDEVKIEQVIKDTRTRAFGSLFS